MRFLLMGFLMVAAIQAAFAAGLTLPEREKRNNARIKANPGEAFVRVCVMEGSVTAYQAGNRSIYRYVHDFEKELKRGLEKRETPPALTVYFDSPPPEVKAGPLCVDEISAEGRAHIEFLCVLCNAFPGEISAWNPETGAVYELIPVEGRAERLAALEAFLDAWKKKVEEEKAEADRSRREKIDARIKAPGGSPFVRASREKGMLAVETEKGRIDDLEAFEADLKNRFGDDSSAHLMFYFDCPMNDGKVLDAETGAFFLNLQLLHFAICKSFPGSVSSFNSETGEDLPWFSPGDREEALAKLQEGISMLRMLNHMKKTKQKPFGITF